VYPKLSDSLDCFCFVFLRLEKQSKNNPEKLTTSGKQDEEKQNKHNLEKLTTSGKQDEEKQNKHNLEKLTTVFLDCFCFVFLRLVYTMLSDSLDLPCLIAHSSCVP
jgi:hypothetical protein